MGWGDISCHGGAVPTPNIDSLAQSGMELKCYYTYPLCSPTRAALLTGLMPKRFGIVNALQARDEGLPAGLPTLPRTLQAVGYQTMAVGKWHVGYGSPPMKSGFEHFYGFLGPEIDYFQHTSRNGQVDWQRNQITLREEGYSTELLANEAMHLIEERDAQRPFYLHVAFNAPHFPLAAPPEYLAKVAHLPRAQAVRAAVIDALDNAIGRILETLDEQGLRNNTVVVFVSDNGADQTGRNTPLRGTKGSLYEGGIHVPCFLRWPSIVEPGSVCQQPLCAQDWYPTILSAVGLASNDLKLDGCSQWPAITSGKLQARECFSIAAANTALIDGPWKLIEFSNGTRSLFNVVDDPQETRDLALIETERVQILSEKVSEQQKQFPPLPNRVRRGPALR